MSSRNGLTRVLGLAVALGAAGCGSVSLNPDGGSGRDGAAGIAGGGGTGGGIVTTGGGGTTGAGGVTGGGGATGGSGGAGATGAAGATGGSGGVTTGSAGAGGHAGGTGGAGATDGGTTDAGKSDTITLQLVVPADKSFCDTASSCSPATHITIMTTAGVALDISTPSCATICSTSCRPELCPEIACLAPRGVAFTGTEITWDGTTYAMSTCGSAVPCYAPKKVVAGRYVAHMCATPGTLSNTDAGLSGPTCTATAPEKCVDVPFDIPGPTPIEGKLP